MGFTSNQVRHFYVASKPAEGELIVKHEGTEVTDKLKDTEKPGAIKAHINAAKDHLYFEYMSPAGPVRTDLINLSKIDYIKHIDAKKMRHPLKQYKVSFDKTVDFKGDVVLALGFKRFLSLSEDDQQITVSGHVGEEAIPASDYFKHIAHQLAHSIHKGFTGMVKVELETGGTDPKQIATVVPVTHKTKLTELTDTYTGIVITELPQPWSRGLHPQGLGVDFEASVAIRGASPVVKGIVEEMPIDLDNRSIKNGHKIADMEYFYHGVRGDIYRKVNFPYHFETAYVANPEEEYDVLEIHYAFADQGTSTFHSEKDLTLALCCEEAEQLLAAIKEVVRKVGVEL